LSLLRKAIIKKVEGKRKMIKVIRLSDEKEFVLATLYKEGNEEGVTAWNENGEGLKFPDGTYRIIFPEGDF
jgi:hypothetical protein